MSSTTDTSREPAEYTQSEIAYGQVVNDAKSGERGRDGADAAADPPVVVAALADGEAQRVADKWRRREHYRIVFVVLDVVVLLTALATVAVAAKVFHDCTWFRRPGSDSPFLDVIGVFFLYIPVLIEGVLSFIAALVILIRVLRKPESVLLRAPFDQGKFVCLCISLVLLLLWSGYSIAAPIISSRFDLDPAEPVALCVIPAVRVAAFLCLLGVLIANRRM